METVLENEKVKGKPVLILLNSKKMDIKDACVNVMFLKHPDIQAAYSKNAINKDPSFPYRIQFTSLKGEDIFQKHPRNLSSTLPNGIKWLTSSIRYQIVNKDLQSRIALDVEEQSRIYEREREAQKLRVAKWKEQESISWGGITDQRESTLQERKGDLADIKIRNSNFL